MDDLIVIDDFLPEKLQEKLDLIAHNNFKWKYTDNTAYNEPSFDHYLKNYSGVYNTIKDSGQMSCPIFHVAAPSGETEEQWLDLVTTLVYFMFDRVPGSSISEYVRIKANLNTRKGEEYKGTIATPHVDTKYPGSKTILYYLNGSDGDTLIYNERYPDTLEGVPLTLRQRVTPKRGRAIIFDSDIVHSHMYNLESDTRLVLNLCFKEEIQGEEFIIEDELEEIAL